MLQVKFDFRLKIFSPGLILNFLCLLALIIHELGQGDKGNENQAGLKNQENQGRLNQNKPEIKLDL